MPSSSGHRNSILSLLQVVRRGDAAAGMHGFYGPHWSPGAPDPRLWDDYPSVVAGAMRYAWTWQGRTFPSSRPEATLGPEDNPGQEGAS